jgi:hypothetical protein
LFAVGQGGQGWKAVKIDPRTLAVREVVTVADTPEFGAGTALVETRCSIYEHRPQCCRTFECRLLQNVRRGEESVQGAHQRIAETQANIAKVTELVSQLGLPDRRLPLVERVAEALAGECDSGPLGRTRAELRTAMSTLQRSIGETFLHGRRGARR